MPRARNIKPGFFNNEHLCELPPHARLLFAGLWTLADREGRLEDRPKKIRAEIFPYEGGISVENLLAELANANFILRYEKGGRAFIFIQSWRKHQHPHRMEAASEIPPPDSLQSNPGATPVSPRSSTCADQDLPQCNPADSLIPDSLIPDCSNPVPTPEPNPAETKPEALGFVFPPDITPDMADWVERMYALSRKRKHRILAEQYVCEHIGDGRIGTLGVPRALFEKRWRAANESEDWQWRGGAKAQTLAEWVQDGNYRYDIRAPDKPTEVSLGIKIIGGLGPKAVRK